MREIGYENCPPTNRNIVGATRHKAVVMEERASRFWTLPALGGWPATMVEQLALNRRQCCVPCGKPQGVGGYFNTSST